MQLRSDARPRNGTDELLGSWSLEFAN